MTLVLKPGEFSAPVPLNEAIDAVRITNANHQLSGYALDVQGGVLTIKATPPPEAAREAATELSLEDMTSRLDELLSDKFACGVPHSTAVQVHNLISSEAGWEALKKRIGIRWKDIRSWRLVPGLAQEAADLVARRMARSQAPPPAAPSGVPSWMPDNLGVAKEKLADPKLPQHQRAAIMQEWGRLIELDLMLDEKEVRLV
jgi:hypothetical protein